MKIYTITQKYDFEIYDPIVVNIEFFLNEKERNERLELLAIQKLKYKEYNVDLYRDYRQDCFILLDEYLEPKLRNEPFSSKKAQKFRERGIYEAKQLEDELMITFLDKSGIDYDDIDKFRHGGDFSASEIEVL